MNTPPTRKRNLRRVRSAGTFAVQDASGTLSSGIHAEPMQAAYAHAISFWPFVEDGMTRVLLGLLGVEDMEIATEIFHALIAQNTRLPVMRALLQNTAFNSDKPEEFDQILDDFKKLNDQRNRYVHGYWFTHVDSQRSYLCKSNQSAVYALIDSQMVEPAELEKFRADCWNLFVRTIDLGVVAIQANRKRR